MLICGFNLSSHTGTVKLFEENIVQYEITVGGKPLLCLRAPQ